MATIKGNNKNNTLKGKGGDDDILGKGGNDKLYGNAGKDKLYGGDGKDKLYGGNAGDVLKGGDGDDQLYGGAGRDELYGGKGKDKFYFEGMSSGRDDLMDFDIKKDKIFIDLDAYGYSSLKQLFNNMKESGSDTWIMLNKNDPGDDTHQIFVAGVSSHNDLKGHVFDIDL